MDTPQADLYSDCAHPEAQIASSPFPSQSGSSESTLLPSSDVTLGAPGIAVVSTHHLHSLRPAVAVAIGVVLAVLVGSVGSAHASWKHFAGLFRFDAANSLGATDLHELDQLTPQQQAEALLELAGGNTDGALEQISERLDNWRGKISWDAEFAAQAASALNSNNLHVRAAGIEVELVAYGLQKNSSTVDALLKDAASADHARKVWALWALGLLANRGVEPERVTQILTAHLSDSDEDSRRWSVDSLALVGTTPTIEIFLRTLHDDPSPSVRERAACSLAESGMLTQEQRATAVPQLLIFSADPTLDSQTHAWTFQALGDITHQRLPNDATAWRTWYTASNLN
jgi:hypothetical protein